jgi:hypothetical protein
LRGFARPNLSTIQIISKKERTMKNPLDSLWGTVIAGVVLTAVLLSLPETFWAKGE